MVFMLYECIYYMFVILVDFLICYLIKIEFNVWLNLKLLIYNVENCK